MKKSYAAKNDTEFILHFYLCLACNTMHEDKKTDCKSGNESIKLDERNVQNKSKNINHVIQEKETLKCSKTSQSQKDLSKLNMVEQKDKKVICETIPNGGIKFDPPIIKISLMNSEEMLNEFNSSNSPMNKKSIGEIVIVATTPEITFYSEEHTNGNNISTSKGEQRM